MGHPYQDRSDLVLTNGVAGANRPRLTPGSVLRHVSVAVDSGTEPVLVAVFIDGGATMNLSLIGGWIRGSSAISRAQDLRWTGEIHIAKGARLTLSARIDGGTARTVSMFWGGEV